MKRKQHGMISIIIVVTVMVPTVIYAVHSLQSPVRNDGVRSLKPYSEIAIPDASVIKEITRLEKEITKLANPPKPEQVKDTSIRFWRYSDKKHTAYEVNDYGEEKVDLKGWGCFSPA